MPIKKPFVVDGILNIDGKPYCVNKIIMNYCLHAAETATCFTPHKC